MKKDADDAETAIISSSEKVVLDFLERDIAAQPERLQPVTAEQVRRTQSLVGDVSVELASPLPPDDGHLRSTAESLGSSAAPRVHRLLLFFAQFEREVTGERIRDKIAASKRKGMWMGGVPPLGYDVENRRLVPNEREAKLIRHIFQRFVELGSSTALVKELKLDGVTSKAWTTQ